MSTATIWIAIEGPCLAGKTTLGDALVGALGSHNVSIIPDYADFVGGARGMPDPDPRRWEQERDGLEALLEIEVARLRAHRPDPTPSLMIIDRSVLTLIAHCAGTDHKARRDPGFADRAAAVLEDDPRPRWPDGVVYLDVSPEVQIARNRSGKFAASSVFIAPDYNAGFRSYFQRQSTPDGRPMAWIDGAASAEAVLEDALNFLSARLGLDALLQRPGR